MISFIRAFLCFGFLVSTAYGGRGDSTEGVPSQLLPSTDSKQFIVGGGINGPLAFASVGLYALDTRFDQLYDAGNPIAVGATNAYAQITDLQTPTNVSPPYILTIDGTNAIDLNAGVAPVIKKLVTILTQESLDSRQPIYATPYTTLAYHMLRSDVLADAPPANAIVTVADKLAEFNQLIVESVGFGISIDTDVFTTPPVITGATTIVEQQQLVVQYRAAIEALSSLLHEMSLSSKSGISSDVLLEVLALDLYDDGMINALRRVGVYAGILAQDPMTVQITNTQYQVKDIVSLMVEERALVADGGNIIFLKDNIVVDLQSIKVPSVTGATQSTLNNVPSTVGDKCNANAVLCVDFDDHPGGPYTRQDAIDDFDADQSKGHGWSAHAKNTDIVPDPSGDPTRGNVMRITHDAGKAGGGPRFKARLPAKDEYYLSYDIFIPKSNELMKNEKLPGLMFGSLLDAGHKAGEKPIPEGVKGLKARLQLLKPGTYTARGDTNQLTCYIYDADRVQYNRWFNLVDPVSSPDASTWSFPKGQWVTVELRVKQNTATAQEDAGDRNDGVLQAWVDGQLAVDRQNMHWRTVNTMHVDGITFTNFYGGNMSDSENKPSKTQYAYFDNFIVSTSPITH